MLHPVLKKFIANMGSQTLMLTMSKPCSLVYCFTKAHPYIWCNQGLLAELVGHCQAVVHEKDTNHCIPKHSLT